MLRTRPFEEYGTLLTLSEEVIIKQQEVTIKREEVAISKEAVNGKKEDTELEARQVGSVQGEASS